MDQKMGGLSDAYFQIRHLFTTLLLMAVFWMAYFVAFKALEDTRRTLSWSSVFLDVLWDGFLLAYFQMYGELNLDE